MYVRTCPSLASWLRSVDGISFSLRKYSSLKETHDGSGLFMAEAAN
jgi:hypothetical protein